MPVEVHEHYDADGNLTGTTVVRREPDWTDEDRGRALRLAEYENGICGCGCQQPIRKAYDKQQAFIVKHTVCQAGRAMDQVKRRDREDAEARKLPAGWDDGRHYFVQPHEQEVKDGDRPQGQRPHRR